MISLWKLREKKNVAQMPFVKNTPDRAEHHAFALFGVISLKSAMNFCKL